MSTCNLQGDTRASSHSETRYSSSGRAAPGVEEGIWTTAYFSTARLNRPRPSPHSLDSIRMTRGPASSEESSTKTTRRRWPGFINGRKRVGSLGKGASFFQTSNFLFKSGSHPHLRGAPRDSFSQLHYSVTGNGGGSGSGSSSGSGGATVWSHRTVASRIYALSPRAGEVFYVRQVRGGAFF